jgi:hypothetical protein
VTKVVSVFVRFRAYATAFIPIALFPLLRILDAIETAENYGDNYVLMLLGGFLQKLLN